MQVARKGKRIYNKSVVNNISISFLRMPVSGMAARWHIAVLGKNYPQLMLELAALAKNLFAC